jgi:hypothetical protein
MTQTDVNQLRHFFIYLRKQNRKSYLPAFDFSITSVAILVGAFW